jgi:hypothetical protein
MSFEINIINSIPCGVIKMDPQWESARSEHPTMSTATEDDDDEIFPDNDKTDEDDEDPPGCSIARPRLHVD